jgi:hypothetical protein
MRRAKFAGIALGGPVHGPFGQSGAMKALGNKIEW